MSRRMIENLLWYNKSLSSEIEQLKDCLTYIDKAKFAQNAVEHIMLSVPQRNDRDSRIDISISFTAARPFVEMYLQGKIDKYENTQEKIDTMSKILE